MSSVRAHKTSRILGIVVTLIYVFMLIPTLIVVPVSFTTKKYTTFPPTGFTLDWYAKFFSSEEFMRALFLSLRLALLATVLAVVVGLLAIIGLPKLWPGLARSLNSLYLGPLVIPRIILGLSVLIVFSRILISGTFTSLLLGHIVIAIPMVVFIIGARYAQMDHRLEEAARSLGASSFEVFRTVTLPLLRPAIIGGGIVGFVVSFDELEMSLFLTGPGMSTFPVTLYHYLQFNSDPMVAAMSVVVSLVSVGVLFVAIRFFGLGRVL